MRRPLSELSKKLAYEFHSPDRLTQAVTHRSCEAAHNERLEFLGDAVLNFLMAEYLYRSYPEFTEGDLSRMRSQLVKGETLADVARDLSLEDYVLLGVGELRSGAAQSQSVLADTLEAIIGAIYLDGGLVAVQGCVFHWFGERIADSTLRNVGKDAKTQLQEYLQAEKQELPVYEVTAIEGEAHQQQFEVRCHIPGLSLTAHGTGSSRRRAEQSAANTLLNTIQKGA